jgi:hypothetical protein
MIVRFQKSSCVYLKYIVIGDEVLTMFNASIMNQTIIKLFQKHQVNQIDRKQTYSFDTWGIFEEKSHASFLQNFTTNFESPNQEHGQKMKNFVTSTSS